MLLRYHSVLKHVKMLLHCSTWMHFLENVKQSSKTRQLVFVTAAMLGVGGSTLLVTVLTMTADLIGENMVSVMIPIITIIIIVIHYYEYSDCYWLMSCIHCINSVMHTCAVFRPGHNKPLSVLFHYLNYLLPYKKDQAVFKDAFWIILHFFYLLHYCCLFNCFI